MKTKQFAPIVMFVYNRKDHVEQVLEELSKNKEAKQSTLYIFSDGAKNEKQEVKVQEVRDYIDSIKEKEWFKGVIITKEPKNKGLANSVIQGVDKVIKEYGKVIVIEDDSVPTHDFLEYMNNGLEFFETNNKVFSVGGFTPNMKIPEDYKHDIFLQGRNSSYAWATWKDRWDKIDWAVSDYKRFQINPFKRHKLNKCGNDRSCMLDLQMHGKIDSWAIRFCYAMVCNNMYTVLPVYSRIKSIGNDGSGTHCGNNSKFDVEFVSYGKSIVMEDVDFDKGLSKMHAKFNEMTMFARFKMYIKTNILKL